MEDYKNKGKSLTGTIAEPLILELFDGRTDVPTREIIEEVTKLHLSQGGLPQTTPKTQAVTVGLSRLKRVVPKKGNNPNQGFWTINSAGIEVDISAIPASVDRKEDTLTVGQGSSTVYLYYFPEYKKGEYYPCKVGKTDADDVLGYVVNQAGAALPEKPKIGLLIKTDNPNGVETGIHGLLDDKGRRKTDAPGREWFVTNTDEVKHLYDLAIHIR